MASSADVNNSSPFEGPEKLLEIWFAPSPALVPGASSTSDGRYGLRKVDRSIWEDMLDIVKCQVLSVVQGDEIDAYLLSRARADIAICLSSESSLFISPHRLILKTCGTTLNLLGLPRILDIAREHAGLPSVYRFFWSRKSYFFPERQSDLHREWKNEVEFLDGIFQNGAAYTVGKVNGDHWLLYLTNPSEDYTGSPVSPAKPLHDSAAPAPEQPGPHGLSQNIDYTIEILMTRLAPDTSNAFIFGPETDETTPSERACALSSSIGITDLFPAHLTTLDAYAFSPCGYSSNALLKWGHAAEDEGQDEQHGGEGYYTIHVTPEEGWSYASFECNVPLPTC
ncbi:hypothetical protein EVG20_g3030, partial [Dentipellis fragilis]